MSELCNPIMVDRNRLKAQSKKELAVSSNKNYFLSNYSVKNNGLQRSDENSMRKENGELISQKIVDNQDSEILAMASFYDRPEYT